MPEDYSPAPEPEPSVASSVSERVVSRFAVRRDFLEQYDFLEYIGKGGQGDLWKVWDFEFRRVVAMKRMAAGAMQSKSAVYRFIAEAQIASQLEHPGVLPVFDAGLDPEGRPFYTTQLLPGTTFGDIWQKVRDPAILEWPINRALELLLRVCDVMAHAHSRGVIHRDLKPPNILVGAFGDVRVIDWGSAHVARTGDAAVEDLSIAEAQMPIQTDREKAIQDDPGSPLSTGASGLPMTVLFTAPELLRGEVREIGPQTDIYSLGIMLYELLTGRPPYSDDDGELPLVEQLKQLIKDGSPAPVRKVNSNASRDLTAICEKAMAHEKLNRYSTMTMLADDIRAALELRPVQARRPGYVLKAQRFAQRHAGYVFLVCLIAVVAASAFAILGHVRRQRDVALQVQALRDGELAGRNGRWREALRHWDEAQAAGYGDSIYLDLQRAEAWTILAEPDRSGALLQRLSHRSTLGPYRGIVLLRLGEHELFDQATAREGVQRIREALTTGLDAADTLFAKGLLADTTPEALDFFHQAIKINSFHHGAHRHSLGLEFLLGRHAELRDSLRFFATIYPDDPSAGFLEAAELALQGKLKEAQARMVPLRSLVGAVEWTKLNDGLPSFAIAAKRFDPDALLAVSHPALPSLDLFTSAERVAGIGRAAGAENVATRMPYLPSIQKGLLEGRAALTLMMLPSIGNIDASVSRIKTSWQHHPEALAPMFAGIYLETRQPTNGPQSSHLLKLEADLFQLAADSPSILAGLDRTSRYLAAKTELELYDPASINAASLRKSCISNISRAMSSSETSTAELKAYFGLAMKLGDYDLARALMVRWEAAVQSEASTLPSRIDLEIASGNLEAAWKLVTRSWADSPNDARAIAEREAIQRKLVKLIDLIHNSREFNYFPGKP